jgi:hypothetical protein
MPTRSGAQLLSVELVGSAGLQGVLEQTVSIAGGHDAYQVDIPVDAHGTTGTLAFVWELTTPGGTGICGGALRESMVFTIDGASVAIPAIHWLDAMVPISATISDFSDSALMPSVAIGAKIASAKLMNTQAGTVEDQRTIHGTVIGGRTSVADPFVFSGCPY